jgi:uridine kinase
MSINSSQQIISAICKIKKSKSTAIVDAIAGGSGSGKSSLAQQVSNEFDLAFIQLDDFFSGHIPEHIWDTFSVSERYKNVFDWHSVRTHVLEPLISRK